MKDIMSVVSFDQYPSRGRMKEAGGRRKPSTGSVDFVYLKEICDSCSSLLVAIVGSK
jgi:hypothetical protein